VNAKVTVQTKVSNPVYTSDSKVTDLPNDSQEKLEKGDSSEANDEQAFVSKSNRSQTVSIQNLSKNLQGIRFALPGEIRPGLVSSSASPERKQEGTDDGKQEISHLNLSRPIIPENRRRGRSIAASKNSKALLAEVMVESNALEPDSVSSGQASETIDNNQQSSIDSQKTEHQTCKVSRESDVDFESFVVVEKDDVKQDQGIEKF
jgi:hypothetical protein